VSLKDKTGALRITAPVTGDVFETGVSEAVGPEPEPPPPPPQATSKTDSVKSKNELEIRYFLQHMWKLFSKKKIYHNCLK
jgi:hypothetical protein